jgi:hypothetical protein
MAYRDDLTALSARHDALTAEVAQKTRELEESSRLLEHVRARARLPVLDQIQVASPCSASWNQMTGDERTRHCGACDKDVYNLSGMTREEAEALIIERNGELCVRYYQRADGTILLADCTVGVQRKRHQRRTATRAAALVAGGLAAAGSMVLHARETEPPCALPLDGHIVMGDLKADPAPPPPPAPPELAPGAEQVHLSMGLVSRHAKPPTQHAERDRRLPSPSMKLPADPPSDSSHPRLEPQHEPARVRGR